MGRRHAGAALWLVLFCACSRPPPVAREPDRAAVVPAGPASLIADLASAPPVSAVPHAEWIWAAGPITFFAGTEPATGTELWRTDGTSAGTSLVADICPGPCSSRPERLGAAGPVALFSADDGSLGRELWRTDGTPEGTFLLKEVNPGASPGTSFYPTGFREDGSYGGRVWFTVNDPDNGYPGELWVSDGTEAGTLELPMLNGMSWVVGELGGKVLVADDCMFSRDIWTSDGTVDGTQVLTSVPPGAGLEHCLDSGETVTWQGRLWASVYHGAALWSSDGTAEGTTYLDDPDARATTFLVASGDSLYFVGSPSSSTQTLYRSDGSEVTAIGTVGLNASRFVGVGGRVLFADAGQWWIADAATPPQPFGGIVPSAGQLTMDGLLYFGGSGSVWVTDGTSASPVLDVQPSALGGADGKLLVALFRRWSTDPTALYAVDLATGTAESLSAISNGAGSGAGPIVPIGDVALLRAADGRGDAGLWATDGTSADAVLQGCTGEAACRLLPLGGGRALFVYPHPDGVQLWVTDGTAGGTVPASTGVFKGWPPLDLQSGAALGGVGVFAASDAANGLEAWRSDGTAEGTSLLANIGPYWKDGAPRDFTVAAGRVWFTAGVDAYLNRGIFATDGTTEGTVQIGILDPYTGKTGEAASTWFAELAGAVYFGGREFGTDTADGLYRSDGIDAVLVKRLAVAPTRAAAAGGLLFFAADDGTGPAIWRSDGSEAGTARLAGVADVTRIVALGDRVVFFGIHPALGREPWVSDGTVAGTHVVKDVRPGGYGSVSGTVASGDVLALPDAGIVIFSASDGASGAEPWVTDGTEAGTFLVQDLAAGWPSSAPGGFARLGGEALFLADDGVHGREPWKLPVAAVDLLPPVIACPAPISADAPAAGGVAVEVPSATAEDAITLVPGITRSVEDGFVFPVGTTAVVFTATDDAGNSASCTTEVTVTAPPASPPAGGCGSAGGAGPLALLAAAALARRRGR